jgi:hypothetical protein
MHSRTPHVRLVDLKARTAGSGIQHLGSDPCDRQQYQHQGPSTRRFDSFVDLFAPNDPNIIDGHCELLRSSRRRPFCVCTRWSRSSLENLPIAVLRSRSLEAYFEPQPSADPGHSHRVELWNNQGTDNRVFVVDGYKGAHDSLSEVGDVGVKDVGCGCAACLSLVSKSPPLGHQPWHHTKLGKDDPDTYY